MSDKYYNLTIDGLDIKLQYAKQSDMANIYSSIKALYSILERYMDKNKYQGYYDVIENIITNKAEISAKKYYDNLVSKNYTFESVINSIINDEETLKAEKTYWECLPGMISNGGLFNLKPNNNNWKNPYILDGEVFNYKTVDGVKYWKLSKDSKIYKFLKQFDIKVTKAIGTKNVTIDSSLIDVLSSGEIQINGETIRLFSSENGIKNAIKSIMVTDIVYCDIGIQLIINSTLTELVKKKICDTLEKKVKEEVTFHITSDTYLNEGIKDDNNSKILIEFINNNESGENENGEKEPANFYYGLINNVYETYKKEATKKYDSIKDDKKITTVEKQQKLEEFRKELKQLEELLTVEDMYPLDNLLIRNNIKDSTYTNSTLKASINNHLTLNSAVKNQNSKFIDSFRFSVKASAESFCNKNKDDINKDDINKDFSTRLPLLFFESYQKNKIDFENYQTLLDNIGKGLVPKMVFNSAYFLKTISSSNTTYDNIYYTCSTEWRAYKKLENCGIKINGQVYKAITKAEDGFEPLSKASEKLTKWIKTAIDNIWKSFSDQLNNDYEAINTPELADWNSEVRKRLNSSLTPEDFFFIEDVKGKRRIPTDKFVDMQFVVPKWNKDNSCFTQEWVSVTDKENHRVLNNSGYNASKAIPLSQYWDSNVDRNDIDYILPGDYLSSFVLKDGGNGGKTVEIVMKSPDDANLENIIISSLSVDHITKDNNLDNTNSKQIVDTIFSEAFSALQSNFRLRFGYLDQSNDDGKNVIRAKESDNIDFINRVNFNDKSAKQTLEYPWTYFKITDISSQIIDGEITYNIKACESAQYILNELCLSADKSINFNEEEQTSNGDVNEKIGRSKNVIGKLAGYLYEASNGRICVLGYPSENTQRTDSILTGYNVTEKKYLQDITYELRDKNSRLKGSTLNLIGDFFSPKEGNEAVNPDVKTFNIVGKNSANIVAIKDLLDELCDYEPQLTYMVAKDGDDVYALRLTYDEISKLDEQLKTFYEKTPLVTKKLKYQVTICDAKIKKNGSYIDDDFRKTCFIRFYYDGPEKETDEENSSKEYLRVYNNNGVKDQVITNISLNNGGPTLANYQSTVTVIGNGGAQMTFNQVYKQLDTMENIEKEPNNTFTDQDTGEYDKIRTRATTDAEQSRGDIKIVSKSLVTINHSVNASNNSSTDKSNNTGLAYSYASQAFTKLAEQAYTGEITIYGDPFYYFDTSVEPGIYEIYLNMDRSKSVIDTRLAKSYFSGLYYIKGITHTFRENGDYTTTLDVVKRVIGTAGKTVS